MRKSIKADLEDLCDAAEHVKESLARLIIEETVDVGARIRALAKIAKAIDELTNEAITSRLHKKDGIVKGESFRAIRATHNMSIFDLKRFEVEEPTLAARFRKTNPVARITYEAR